jgi:uncharacterized protein with ParB-like and HNH nuclease domain
LAKNRLTNNSDETDISSLLSGDTVFTIPYFQRPYKWKSLRLKQLHDDILRVVDENDFHFLGALIVHGRRSNPSDPDLFDVIDGQQRITTLYIYLAALVKTLCDLEEYDVAKGLFLKYLVIGRDIGHISNMKLHSCKEDRAQLNYVLRDVLSSKAFVTKLGAFKLKYLPSTGASTGTLRNNYRKSLSYLKDEVEQAGSERIREIYSAVLSNMSVVQIDVSDPTNGPKIFDSLNSRQEPMTIGDLIRNEIFSRIADEDPATIESIDDQYWQPFYKRFHQNGKNLFDKYFFPYGLIQKPNLKKSEVYDALRKQWEDLKDPDTIINTLATYQNAFIDILCGSNFQDHPKSVFKLFQNLSKFKAPSSVYPFMMQLSNAIQNGSLAESEGIAILEVIEAFLVRRAVCGYEPTGLHSVFKRLWVDCDNQPTRKTVIANIKKHKTVMWPTTNDFRKALIGRPLYGSGITNYLVLEYDRSLSGDQPDNVPWIEHVLPDKPEDKTWTAFSKAQHAAMKDLLSNLIPLSAEMNRKISNKEYHLKQPHFKNDSMFKSAREFAEQHTESWTPELLMERANVLAAWAENRWASEL